VKKLILILKNKYLLAIVFFAVWLTFFDRYDLITQSEFRNELNDLRTERKYYLQEINKNNEIMNALKNDSIALEKFAREKYLMKKDNEDIFVIENLNDTLNEQYPE
jgi:cell division protein DivIC